MRKVRFLLAVMVTVVLMVCARGMAEAQTAYATFSNGTLTFYYGTKPNGAYSMRTSSSNGWSSISKNIINVVFDESFKNYDLKSCSHWFDGCSNLTSIDLSSLNTKNLGDMSFMFWDCKNLETIYVGDDWNTQSVYYKASTFYGCQKLVGCKGTKYDKTKIDAEYAKIDEGYRNPGYLTKFGEPTFDDGYAVLKDSILTFFCGKDKPEGAFKMNAELTAPSWKKNEIKKVIFDVSYKKYKPISCGYWFSGAYNLIEIENIENLNTSDVRVMTDMFGNCNRLTHIDLSNFNTENVESMNAMFRNCTQLTYLDLSSFNTENVISMEEMFESCTNLAWVDLSSFNTKKVQNMRRMFYKCSKLRRIYVDEHWTTNAVANFSTYTSDIFYDCVALEGGNGTKYTTNYISNAKIDEGNTKGYLTRGKPLFGVCDETSGTLTLQLNNINNAFIVIDNNDLVAWKEKCKKIIFDETMVTYRTASCYKWFENFENLTEVVDIANFNTTNVTNMSYMFSGCKSLKGLDLSSFNTTNVTNMSCMFSGCTSLKELDLSGFNTTNVTYMSSMFLGCTSLEELDLSSFNTKKTSYMNNMFSNCSNLKTISISNSWKISNEALQNDMFLNCEKLEGGKGTAYNATWNTGTVLACADGGVENPGYLTDKNGDIEIKEREKMAYGVLNGSCVSFYYDDKYYKCNSNSLNTYLGSSSSNRSSTKIIFNESFKEYKPTSCSNWFYDHKYLSTIEGLENINTENVTTMYQMFAACTWLTKLDLRSFDTKNVKSMYSMFSGCTNLTEINLDGLNTENVTSMEGMFSGCSSIEKIKVAGLNTQNVTSMEGMFYKCTNLTDVDLSGLNTEKVKYMDYMFGHCSNLKELDLSSFNTANVTFMMGMFYDDQNLETIYVGDGWNTDNVPITYNEDNYYYREKDVFYNCEKLVGGKGSAYNPDWNNTSIFLAHADGGDDYPGYFTSKNNKLPAITERAYAVKIDSCIYFYCDKNGYKYPTSAGVSKYFNPNKDFTYSVNKIIFDKTFKNYQLTSCRSLFYTYYPNLEKIIGLQYLNTQNVSDMSKMFYQCSKLTELDISHFNTENVTDMSYMFSGCSNLKELDISSFKTENVTTMSYMFQGCSNLTELDLSNFNTENVANMSGMFSGCNTLKELDLRNFNVDKVTKNDYMFSNCSNLELAVISYTWTKQGSYMFNNTNKLSGCVFNKLTLPSCLNGYATFNENTKTFTFDVTNKTIPSGSYAITDEIPSWNSADINLRVEKVVFHPLFRYLKPESCYGWFFNFKNLTEIEGIEYLNTESVKNMSLMFAGCKTIKELDLSYFDTKNVSYMTGMFGFYDTEAGKKYYCDNLETVYVGKNWTTKYTDDDDLFEGCKKLTGEKGTAYSGKNIGLDYAQIDGGTSNPGYFTEKDNEPRVIVSIKLSKLPTKTEYFEGEELKLDGGEITVNYNKGAAETVKLTDENIETTSLNSTTAGKKTITVIYMDEFSDEFSVNVIAKAVSSIKISRKPQKLTYKKGEPLSVDDGELTVTYNNGDVETVLFSADGVEFSGYDNQTLGNQTITVTYFKKTAAFNVTVTPEKDITKIEVTKSPTKTEYFTGEDFEVSGGELTVTYDDNSKEIIALSKAALSGFDSKTAGAKTIKVVYFGAQTTFEVTVKAKSVVSIEVTLLPKTEYVTGEDFSALGGKITVKYDNETSEVIDLSQAVITGYDKTQPGKQTLKVKYEEKETAFEVTVVDKSVVSIEVTSMPKTEYVIGEDFSALGGEITVKYDNETSEVIDLSQAVITGYDKMQPGDQILTVTYQERKAALKVVVSQKEDPEQPEQPEQPENPEQPEQPEQPENPVVENPFKEPEIRGGYFQITDFEELMWLMFEVNTCADTRVKVVLNSNIIVNKNCLQRVLKSSGIAKADGDLTVWQPVGTLENPFNGYFDGQGHVISGIYIDDKSQEYAGLFGVVGSEAVIKNFGVVDSYISGGENVGAICGKSEGKIENCYSLSEVKGTENVNGIAGKVESTSTVENCYYLAETPKENDPCAKTAAEFKSGEVAELLAKGGEAWKDVKELPGVESVVVPDEPEQPENPENPETATENITLSNVKIWSFEKTIIVENAEKEIVIADMSGRVVKNIKPENTRTEIHLNKGGIFLVKTGLSTKKVVIR